MFAITYAQNGNVKGVINDNNGIAISGASVIIEKINKGVVSDFDGKFTLVNIPTGDYTLQINYLGFETLKKEIQVISDKTVSIAIVLEPRTIELDGVTIVAPQNNNQILALNKQKNNINVSNVISTDQIGKYPDSNIGDAIKRVSGITIQVDQGEARDIIVRGLSPELNSVTINGSRIPSAEGDNRNVQMDLIPSDMIQSIEVSKALTPEMDADALGGSVNLVTRTSPQKFRLSATLGSGLNLIYNKRIWNASFFVGDRSKNGKFGWMISSSINDNEFGSQNIEAEWSNRLIYNTGTIDGNGDPILVEDNVLPYTKVLEQQTHFIQRVRRSFALNFDYQFSTDHTLYFKSIYNWRDDRENRVLLESEILSGEDIEEDDFTIVNQRLTRFPVEVSRQIRGGIENNRNKNARLEDQRMQNYTLGGDHLLGSTKINWLVSYSKSSEDNTDERVLEFKSQYFIINDNSDPELPLFRPVIAGSENDLSSFLYDELEQESNYSEEEDVNFFINTEIPLNFWEKSDGNLKFGFRGRFKNKFLENDFLTHDLSGQFPTLADVPFRDYSDPDFLVGSQYQAGFFPQQSWLGSLILEGGEPVPSQFLGENFKVKEDVFAAYIQTQQKINEKTTLLTGIRTEITDVKATGNRVEGQENFVGEITESQSYANILPGLHLRYAVTSLTILRFAWSNTLARPNYVDLVPTQDIVLEDRDIVVGNPGLKPTTSMNFDIMAEHYFKNAGILSGGVFYKDIKDFIYTFRSQTIDDRFGEGTTGFNLFQPLNGRGATIFGVELAFQRQLNFLPGFAKNFNLDMNYTFISSSTQGIQNQNGEERTELDLPRTSPHLFNTSLGYKDNRFSARLSLNFSDAYLDEIGQDGFQDIYYDKQLFLDLNASYNFTKQLSVYFGLNNITNQPLRLYQGFTSQINQLEFYEKRLTFGLKYDLSSK
ncbi:TonB-dependent receptor [Aquimarina latercula]|uniref:TonB-dependent receptor n=1 Tax=Aquimarina latercula TaxID=987 RepID=UPI000422FFDF|nr:TonB-dependent receptor [Aquimarina latercula]